MTDAAEPADSSDIEAAWDAWRNRALNTVLGAASIMGALSIIPGFVSDSILLPNWRLPMLAIYLLLVLTAVVPRLGFRVRSRSLVVLAYLGTSILLINRGLIGYGRVGLAIYPCWITILMGSRAGWIATAASLGIYGAIGGWVILGIPRGWGIALDDPGAAMNWLVQSLGLALAMVPSVLILSRFRDHHMQILAGERRLSQQLQDEVARHTQSYESLKKEQTQRARLEEMIARLGEEERRQLGREIHDGLCQQLTAALLRCTALQERLDSRHAEEAEQATRLRILIHEMLDAAYVISRGVWPWGPEPGDLIPALQAMARQTLDEFGIVCEFDHHGDCVVADGSMAMHLYRIAREAVANAAKHAKAWKISVVLDGTAEALVLTVTDDGTGPPDSSQEHRGMGLNIMRYRAQSMGGTLAITDAGGRGTIVRCVAPRGRGHSLEGTRHEP